MVERTDRRYSVESRRPDERTPFQHDRDRILYSTAFRRLAQVTQVVAPTERQVIHNRLTHSLEVAQVGRGLATSLLGRPGSQEAVDDAGGLDADVVEAACLAHDLGHPPFGHVAEKELDRLLTEAGVPDGFEGNAQSFRIVTQLAIRYPEIPGHNLTRATLRAILKYPCRRNQCPDAPNKWGAYDSEADDFNWALELTGPDPSQRSLEAALMDWADDIAYAVHDLEDFYRAGLIPLDRLATDPAERERFLHAEIARQSIAESRQEETRRVFESLMTVSPVSQPYTGTHVDRARLRSFTSALISDYINAAALSSGKKGASALSIDEVKRTEVELLKGLTWYYVINSQALVSQRFGHRRLIQSLFAILRDAARVEDDQFVFPPYYREKLQQATNESERLRTVADYVASLSESQAINLNQRLTGQALGSGFERLL
jgi:dGTPase